MLLSEYLSEDRIPWRDQSSFVCSGAFFDTVTIGSISLQDRYRLVRLFEDTGLELHESSQPAGLNKVGSGKFPKVSHL